ncbi:MAG TPA: PilN domain-containing protein [Vicinamibacterales bacterium]|nr:PilN domain-containing protein [Vicinamibacterales bacterium]
MIRINLVAGERRGVKTGGGRHFDIAQKMTVIGSLIVLVTLLLLGWRYWALGQQEAQLAADFEAALREESRLAEVLKQVTEFENQRAQLQQRVALIDELRRGQNAPVHMIDQISRSLPEMTWLVSLRQEGYDVTLEGRSTSLASLSDLVGNLEATRYFQRPVEIVESEVIRGQKDGADLISFTIKGTFQMSGLELPPGAKPPVKGAK